MICCKIVANYQRVCQHFQEIFDELSKHGDVLWHGRCFYFANTYEDKVDEKIVRKILKKIYGTDFFIEQYDLNFQPTNDDQANWWIEDKLIKIGYIQCEQDQQEQIQFVSQKLQEIEDLLNTVQPIQQSREAINNTTEDK